jgi:imidazolonepropionase-like amidohydrolase
MSASDLVFRRVRLFDGNDADALGVVDIRVVDGRIAEIGDVASRDSTPSFDLDGLTVIPGLIDCHTHLVLTGDPAGRILATDSPALTALRAAAGAAASLRSGITTVRDLGGRDGVEFSLRECVQRAVLPGPRLVLAGKILTITGSIADAMPGMFREVDDIDELRKAVREQLKAGADVIKVMGSGAVMAPGQDPGAPHFSVDEFRTVVEEAHREHRPVAVHAHGAEAVRNALEAGVDSIEHGTFLVEDEEILRRMASEGISLVPTLSFLSRIVEHGTAGGVPEFMFENALVAADRHRRTFEKALELGVPIAFGTDTGSPYCSHGDNARELELMVRFGMPPKAALVAATRDAARCVRLDDEIGTIEVGKVADLVALRGDPLADISCVRTSVALVVQGGQPVWSEAGLVLDGH